MGHKQYHFKFVGESSPGGELIVCDEQSGCVSIDLAFRQGFVFHLKNIFNSHPNLVKCKTTKKQALFLKSHITMGCKCFQELKLMQCLIFPKPALLNFQYFREQNLLPPANSDNQYKTVLSVEEDVKQTC